ncbi:hypothetical protein LCGC14_2901190, partial [marine sediment metagenome]
MTCQRCGVEAELGECQFCHRYLCLACYDGDQEGSCQPKLLTMRDDAIRALRGSLTVGEIAGHFKLSPRQTWRVLS